MGPLNMEGEGGTLVQKERIQMSNDTPDHPKQEFSGQICPG